MTTLFRSEAIAHRADRLSGDVAIAVPVAWQTIGYLLFGGLAAALLFLSFAGYSRVETVGGAVVPDTGVAQIVSTRAGVLSDIAVEDGQMVEADAVLASVRAEEDIAGGGSTGATIEAAIREQDASLAAQVVAANAAAAAQQGQLAAQRAGLSAEIDQLNGQIAIQRDLIASAQADYDRAKRIAERGFVSGRDLQVREETLLGRRQQLSQLQQSLASRRSALAEAGRGSAQLAAQARAQAATVSASRAQVAQQAASTRGGRAYVLRAPLAGRVTALTARTGQSVSPQQPIMTIVPANARLRAELAVPSSAIGFVEPGQEVRLSIDAFPYQRFGTITGKVVSVAGSAVAQRSADGSTVSIYPVVVELSRTAVTAFGREQSLIPGMTLSARIVTERQSLLEWLFEPLFAVRNR